MFKIDWTVSKRIAVIAAIGAVTTLVVGFTAYTKTGTVRDQSNQLAQTRGALVTLRALDTRASELKVDAFKSVTLADPTTAQADVADDTKQVGELIATLKGYDLNSRDAALVDAIETKFGAYTDAIKAFVDAAIKDQKGMLAQVDQIQAANDITDEALGGALDQFSNCLLYTSDAADE